MQNIFRNNKLGYQSQTEPMCIVVAYFLSSLLRCLYFVFDSV